eukprot:CFRG6962T1
MLRRALSITGKKKRDDTSHTNHADKDRVRMVIMGAAGMDYHVFLQVYQSDPKYNVLAFTMCADQNLGTGTSQLRSMPPELSGSLYPEGIVTIPEEELVFFIEDKKVQLVMKKAAMVLASGANFTLISPKQLQIHASVPVIAVCAVRTGCGKSQTARKICASLKLRGLKTVAIREPMPYGNLNEQVSVRYKTRADLERQARTIEEREEYEPYVESELTVYAGVDYQKILEEAESEAEVIVWDGGNNEVCFYKPDFLFVVADPLRSEEDNKSYPGEVDSATPEQIDSTIELLRTINPRHVPVVRTRCPPTISEDEVELVHDKSVLVIEDGPTITHGTLPYGAGYIAAMKNGAKEVLDPRDYIPKNGALESIYKQFKHIGRVLPAMGYTQYQLDELARTIDRSDCDTVIIGTPIDLRKIIQIEKNCVRVHYDIEEEVGSVKLNDVLDQFLPTVGLKGSY